jgi:hypothetical protein
MQETSFFLNVHYLQQQQRVNINPTRVGISISAHIMKKVLFEQKTLGGSKGT